MRGFSLSRVQGHGGELDRVETYRGTTVQIGLADKVRFEIAVSDPFVQPTIDALCAGARTGEVGDGKIFVVPLERAVRIRTGETDDGAVTPVKAPSTRRSHELLTRGREGRYRRHRMDARGHRSVLMMTPALGLFYAGLVRSKNTLNTFMMCIGAIAIAMITWALVGYTLAFDGDAAIIGGFINFLKDVGFEPRAGTTIPHLVFFAFQATFCIITTASSRARSSSECSARPSSSQRCGRCSSTAR